MFKDDSAAVVEEKQEATPEAAPATEEVAAPAAEESKQEEVDAPVAEAVVASEVETQPAQPVSLKKQKFKKKKTQTCFRVWWRRSPSSGAVYPSVAILSILHRTKGVCLS